MLEIDGAVSFVDQTSNPTYAFTVSGAIDVASVSPQIDLWQGLSDAVLVGAHLVDSTGVSLTAGGQPVTIDNGSATFTPNNLRFFGPPEVPDTSDAQIQLQGAVSIADTDPSLTGLAGTVSGSSQFVVIDPAPPPGTLPGVQQMDASLTGSFTLAGLKFGATTLTASYVSSNNLGVIVAGQSLSFGLEGATVHFTMNGDGMVVTKADLYVTATANSKTYGQTATDTGSISGVVTGDSITASFASAGDAATAPVGTGSYPITATLADPNHKLSNYTVHETDATVTVNKAPLTVTANDVTKIQGEANPTFTVRYSGFVLGQGPGDLSSTPTFSLTPTTGGDTITPGGLTSGNYAITFVSGTLTVLSYAQATTNLQAQVDAAGLDQGTQSSLDTQLQAAITYFAAGDTTDGASQLGAFINHVSAQSGQHIDAALANAWIAYAQRIINAVG